jgi:hypothetical protein
MSARCGRGRRYARRAALVTALVITTACGTPGKPDAESSPTASPTSPVSVSVSAPDGYAKGAPGYLLVETVNNGPARASARITLRFGLGSAPGRTLALERDLDWMGKRWAKMPLSSGSSGGAARLKAATGSFTASLPHGLKQWRLRLTPDFWTKTEGETLPIRVSVTDHGHTMATGHDTAQLSTLTTTLTSPNSGPPPLRRGRWTQVSFTITNHTVSDYPRVDVQAYYTACGDSLAEPCSTASGPLPTSALSTQVRSGSTWKTLIPADGLNSDRSPENATLLIATTALPAGTAKEIRLRIKPTSDLSHTEQQTGLTLWSTGLAAGASKHSLGGSSTDFVIR